MNKPKSDSGDGKGTKKKKTKDPVPASPTSKPQKDPDQGNCGEHNPTEKHRPTIKERWEQLRDAPTDRLIELGLACAIFISAAVQVFVVWTNNDSTTQQTNQLITAAKISAIASKDNAAAAQSFSVSADRINKGVSDAVGRLNEQAIQLGINAQLTGRLATATETANSNVVTADRPWMGGMLQSVVDFDSGKKPSFTMVFTNSGKRPAQITFSGTHENWYPYFPSNPDSLYIGTEGEEPSTNILVPGQTVVLSNTSDTPIPDELWKFATSPHSPMTYFVLAKVEYTDLRTNTKHWTHMCFRFYPKFKTDKDWGFRNCKEYNEVDSNP